MNQTKFIFGEGEIFVFWLIHWIDPRKGSTIIRTEEHQSPASRIRQIQNERDIRYFAGEIKTDRFQHPYEKIIPLSIDDSKQAELIKSWLKPFGPKNAYLGVDANGILVIWPEVQLDLF